MPDKDCPIVSITSDSIKDRIHTIRGVQVMLDRDLAELYGVETRTFNQVVKRNANRFPERFCFQLTKDELNATKSQIVILNKKAGRGSNVKYLPYVFTESGVAMLSALLKSKIAIAVSLKIMDAFVAMRHYLADNALVFQRLDKLEVKQIKTEEKVDILFKQLEQPREPKAVMFFKGEMYDAAVLIKELIGSAKSEIILIDNYIDRRTLDCFIYKRKGVSVTIHTQRQNCQILESEIDDFNSQYGSLSLNFINTFHDRFLIIDKTRLYHIGASLKDAGKKAFAISEIEDDNIIKSIVSNI